ncbi:hypothetical protein M408DRAFT_8575 [Serendipita vermifera MAFF 305830]|uniref:Aminopeptidase n=1 Tax=Serendipita vermifera MAFF 305830 TaxID=933852 RepID=A0A0C2WRI9_SERVB|nr:hypothetical protein M408DRAFT_8575 [Serendipita vermifera MAFF 305830]
MSLTKKSTFIDPYRLPCNVKPLHYNLVIKTDLEALKFEGHVAIDLVILEETSTIVLNCADLELEQVSVHSEALKTEQIQIAGQTIDKDQDRVTVQVSTALPAASKAQLRVGFKAPLTGSMTGYYFSQTEIDGKKVHYTLTQFQPTDARKAYPCWDEPAFKATYDITMVSRADTVNLSNMPIASEKPYSSTSDEYGDSGDGMGKLTKMFSNLKSEGSSGGWKVTKFQTTPLISSYLVAFANGPFHYIEGSYTSPISGAVRPVRMYATKEIIHQAKFALDVNVRCLPMYEEMFDVEFPLPKLDTLVAHDFDLGAMENWGLITGRTTAYLIDEEKSDIAAKKGVAETASHEVAHQWFGNITSPEWWDVLYLNEGFATLMGELVILDKLFPEWGASKEFINMHLQSALALDARRSSHPIEVPCDDAKKINQIFDALSYSKAGSVLRMLSDFVTEEKFLKGVSIYLKKHLYSIARTVNLWEGISESTGVNIPDIMDNWINKIGFPVLTVTENAGSITLGKSGLLRTSAGLSLIDAMRSETDCLVWDSIATRINAIVRVWWEMSDVTRNDMNAFRRSLFSPLVKKYGFEPSKDDSHDVRQLRTLAIAEAAAAKDEDYIDRVLQELCSRFKLFVDNVDHSKILPDFQRSAYVNAVSRGGRAEWEAVKKVYKNPPTPSAKTHAMMAMTATTDPALIDETFKSLMTDVKSQDMTYFFSGLNGNRLTRRRLFAFLKENFDEIYKRFEGTFGLGSIIKISLRGFATQDDLDDAMTFFKDKNTSKFAMPLEQSLDGIRADIKWLEATKIQPEEVILTVIGGKAGIVHKISWTILHQAKGLREWHLMLVILDL